MQQAKEGSRALRVDMERSMTGYRGGKKQVAEEYKHYSCIPQKFMDHCSMLDTVLGIGNTTVNKIHSLC